MQRPNDHPPSTLQSMSMQQRLRISFILLQETTIDEEEERKKPTGTAMLVWDPNPLPCARNSKRVPAFPQIHKKPPKSRNFESTEACSSRRDSALNDIRKKTPKMVWALQVRSVEGPTRMTSPDPVSIIT